MLGDLLHVPVALFAVAETQLSVWPWRNIPRGSTPTYCGCRLTTRQCVPTIGPRNFRIWRCQDDVRICCYPSLPFAVATGVRRCRKKNPDGSVAPGLVSLAQRNARSEEKKSLDHELSENQWRLLQLMDKNSVMRSATLAQNHFWIIRQDASFHSQTLHDGTQRGEKSSADGMMFVASRPVWSCWHQWQTKEPKGDDSPQIRILGKQRVIQKKNIRCYSASYSWKSLCCSHLVQINIGAKFLRRGGEMLGKSMDTRSLLRHFSQNEALAWKSFCTEPPWSGMVARAFLLTGAWDCDHNGTSLPGCMYFWIKSLSEGAYFLGIFECYTKSSIYCNSFWPFIEGLNCFSGSGVVSIALIGSMAIAPQLQPLKQQL